MTTTTTSSANLALLGGPRAIESFDRSLFKWPIVTVEDEEAVLAVLRAGSMSQTEITKQFETEFAAWQGVPFALASCNGTMSLLEAMFAVGVGRGDEIIVPSMTYWASALPAFLLGATPVFADIQADSACIDPADIEHRITPRTRAIVAVHAFGHPADLDPILAIAKRHNIKLIEDVSHAQGGLYKGKMLGTFGDVAAMSMMAGKSFAVGEGGMLITRDRMIYERAIAFAHYERHGELTDPSLREIRGLPLGGVKGRLNQTCAAMGRVQLKHYPRRIAEIQSAMNRFWDLLQGTPGIRAHRPARVSGSTMGGWYSPMGHYLPEELDGLPVEKFIEALEAEGVPTRRATNMPLHLQPLLNTVDVFHDGRPTRNAFTAGRDQRQSAGALPVSEAIASRAFGVPWFKHDRPEEIARFADAIKKVAHQAGKIKDKNEPQMNTDEH